MNPKNESPRPIAVLWTVIYPSINNGTDTCSHNRLFLCDEDESEYGPFENQILTNKTFKYSRLMLCIFYALPQPFKKEVFPLLPRKSPKSPILSEVGKRYGEC